MAHHQRSASLPSLPACSTESSSVEEELQALKSCFVSSPSSATIDAASDGLWRLGGVYSSVEAMMRLPSTRVGLSSSLARQRKAVEEELDRSLELIDLCSAVQQSLAELEACVRGLRLVLKRGGGDAAAAAHLKAESFVRLLAKKTAQRSVKKMSGGKAGGAEGCRLVRVMAEARETAVSLLEAMSRLLPRQIVGGGSSRPASKWSLVSARFQRRKVVVCEEEQLRALERGVGDLEDGVEFLFKRLIQSRVSLLNILSS